jgi:hypothetical protein
MVYYTCNPTSTTTVWYGWCNNGTTVTTNGCWYIWNAGTSSSTVPTTSGNGTTWGYWIGQQPYVPPTPETEEQKRAREEANRKWQEESAKRAEKEKAAKQRAEKFLVEHLTSEQAKQYTEQKKFRIRSHSGKLYELDCTKKMHNIHMVDDAGKRLMEFCIYQTGQCPLPDNHLAQKLLLEHDEQKFLKVANARRL